MMKYTILIVFSCLSYSVNADNRSDQMNPNNDAYYQSRGYDERPDDWESESYSSSTRSYSSSEYNNRSNQLNPNNDAYHQSRGYDERPDDWESESYSSSTRFYSSSEYNNRSNQLNPNNDAYHLSRGYDDRSQGSVTTSIKTLIDNNSNITPYGNIALAQSDDSEINEQSDEDKSITQSNYGFSILRKMIHFLSIR